MSLPAPQREAPDRSRAEGYADLSVLLAPKPRHQNNPFPADDMSGSAFEAGIAKLPGVRVGANCRKEYA